MSQSENQQHNFILSLVFFIAFLAVLLISYLAYSFNKANKEYNEVVSSIQDDGYVFATEIYRLPAKKVVVNICGTEDVIFLFGDSILSYEEMRGIEDIYMKKDLFCRA